MKKLTYFFAFVMISPLVLLSCGDTKADPATISLSEEALIKRGRYLVTLAGCGDCHSPKIMTARGPVPDTTRLFAGHRAEASPLEVSKDALEKGWVLINSENTQLATPGFISYAANITSDTTGIGLWSFAQFKTAITKGKWKGLENSRDLLPPMPWTNYAHMSDEDLQAIFAYLRSTRPVKNVVPAPTILHP